MEYQSLPENSLCTDSILSRDVKIYKNNPISKVTSLIFLPFILSGVIRASLHLTQNKRRWQLFSLSVRERSMFLDINWSVKPHKKSHLSVAIQLCIALNYSHENRNWVLTSSPWTSIWGFSYSIRSCAPKAFQYTVFVSLPSRSTERESADLVRKHSNKRGRGRREKKRHVVWGGFSATQEFKENTSEELPHI